MCLGDFKKLRIFSIEDNVNTKHLLVSLKIRVCNIQRQLMLRASWIKSIHQSYNSLFIGVLKI